MCILLMGECINNPTVIVLYLITTVKQELVAYSRFDNAMTVCICRTYHSGAIWLAS